MKEMERAVYNHNGKSCDFNFYTDLSSANKINFVDSVVGIVVDDRHYNSVIKDLIFDFFIIDIFTDVDVSHIKESSFFLDDVEKFLYETDIVSIVKANVSTVVFDELNKAIDDSISYLTGIHINPFNSALASLVSVIEKKIEEFDLSGITDMAQKFAEMTDDFTTENIVNAYMGSDIHKNNLAEIKEFKNKN